MSHQLITVDQVIGRHKGAAFVTPRIIANVELTVVAMNRLCMYAEADGVPLEDDPDTGTAISGRRGGDGGGGLRGPDGAGAPGSAHKDGDAIDRVDPVRALMRWCLGHRLILSKLGLFLEHPQWTSVWVHGQRIMPKSGNRWFVPYADMRANPPTCAALPEQTRAVVRVFPFGGEK